MSPGVVITGFIVALILVFGNKKTETEAASKTDTQKEMAKLSGISVEELARLLESDEADIYVFQKSSK
ncbi:MAG: hypothetical protein AAFR42_10670 [Cyanobacteria bacterium J06628_6]